MKKILMTAVAAVALVALPVAGANARPGGHGHGSTQGNAVEGDTTQGPAGQYTPGRPHTRTPRRCRRMQSVGFMAKGTLAGFTAETITLDVKRANRHARAWIAANGSELTLGSARVKFAGVTDGDASGTVDFADVLPTDQVTAIGKVTRVKRGCSGDPAVTLRRVQVVRPDTTPEPDTGDTPQP